MTFAPSQRTGTSRGMFHYRTSARRAGIAVVALSVLGVTACDDDDREDIGNAVDTLVDEAGEAIDEATRDAAELAVRNFATQQGEEQFTNADHPLDDAGLSCDATITDGVEGVDVTCTGMTQDGGAAELTGTTSEIPGASITELEGTFTGTVDGEVVFETESLGG